MGKDKDAVCLFQVHTQHALEYSAEYHLFYRVLLQKRPIILRSLLIVATPYQGRGQRYCLPVRNAHPTHLGIPYNRGGGLGSSTIFKNLMSPTPRRKWYLTTARRPQ